MVFSCRELASPKDACGLPVTGSKVPALSQPGLPASLASVRAALAPHPALSLCLLQRPIWNAARTARKRTFTTYLPSAPISVPPPPRRFIVVYWLPGLPSNCIWKTRFPVLHRKCSLPGGLVSALVPTGCVLQNLLHLRSLSCSGSW